MLPGTKVKQLGKNPCHPKHFFQNKTKQQQNTQPHQQKQQEQAMCEI